MDSLSKGNDVVSAFGVGKPGPWVGDVLEDVLAWQLDNPLRSKEDCLQWLRNRGPGYYSIDEKQEPVLKRRRQK
jgi:tRNA nucleotidyltransferase (CCA-adding enzyme)